MKDHSLWKESKTNKENLNPLDKKRKIIPNSKYQEEKIDIKKSKI